MDWNTYKSHFIKAAKSASRDNDYIERCLLYGSNLWEQGLPIIYTQEHFSKLVGYDYKYILKASNDTSKFYRTFSIPKRTEGKRIISEPLPSLKEIQRWILDEILNKIPISIFAKAYVKNKSIKENARFHRQQKVVLKVDVSDFFGSIGFQKIHSIFLGAGYSEPVAILLTKLCLLKGSLPQGAPTSAALSNIVCVNLDNELSKYALERKLRYTRYSDDITFSGEFNGNEVIKYVKSVLRKNGLDLNPVKTSVMLPHQKQIVTGIVVNVRLQVSTDIRNKLRQNMYYINKFGLDSHIEKNNITQANYVRHLLGIANYISFVNPRDAKAKQYISDLKKIIK